MCKVRIFLSVSKKVIHIVSGLMLSVMIFAFITPTALSTLHCNMMMTDSMMSHQDMSTSSESHHEMNMSDHDDSNSKNSLLDCNCVYMDDSERTDALFFKKSDSFELESKLSQLTAVLPDLNIEKKPIHTVTPHSPPLLFIRHSSFLI